jgi:acylphosphatase
LRIANFAASLSEKKFHISILTMKHINLKITGKVQGVFFRASTKAVADHMGVKGLVKNEKDGSVYVEAEAAESILEMFVDWCKEGPEKAKVENVAISEGELKNYRNFEVIKKNLLW